MLSVLKCFSSIGAVIMLAVGLAFTGITVYAFINQDVFLSDETIKHNILNGMIIVSATLVSVSITAIVGVVKKKCCIIFIYQIFLVIFIALFAFLGVGGQVIPGIVFQGDCRNSTNPLIPAANNLYNKSDELFCKSACQCTMTTEAFNKYSTPDQVLLGSQYILNATNGATSSQKCPDFDNWTDSTTRTFLESVGQIEKFLECSDWCPNTSKNNLLYRFWDINQGKPTQTCYTALKDAFYYYTAVVGNTCLVIASVLLLVCLCNVCLCCHPNRRKMEFRDRFIYVSDNNPNAQNYRRV